MKFVSISQNKIDRVGLLINEKVYLLNEEDERIPLNMKSLLENWATNKALALEVQNNVLNGNSKQSGLPISDVQLLAPVPYPTSCRDGYAFRQHVCTARRNRGVEMIPEFDQYPIFYFTNHNAIQGEGDVLCMPDHFEKLDFELEVAVVIGKKGRNIKASEADEYIAGYCIMNDFSARKLQMEEMKLNLGPAKGKDFSTAIGPFLVTPDELEQYKVTAKENHTGNSYNLEMNCTVNGKQVSLGNVNEMDWTFAEIIERCAYGTDILPGDVIGSGTVGTGCFLELNGTGKLNDPNYQEQWLQNGDEIILNIEGLGSLKNTIKAVESNMSLFSLKKV